jgi:transposase-like protein
VFLRTKGIHAAVLDEWRQQALAGLRGTVEASKLQTESKQVRELKRELERKDKALAETAALLVLKKKAQAIWGDEDDGTDPKNEK